MEGLSEVKTIKQEPSDLLSTDEQKDPTEMKPCLVKPEEIYIKMEPQEHESEFLYIASTSYEMHTDYNVVEANESIAKIECEDRVDEMIQDPLDGSSELKEAVEKKGELLCTKIEGPIKTKSEDSDKKCNLTFHKESNNKRSNTCHICHMVFAQKYDLDNHIRLHTEERPFSCTICEKTYCVKSSLDKHMMIHNGTKQHACDVCEKVFLFKSVLKEHKLIHSGVKRFSCRVCKKRFTKRRTLVVHKRIHTSEKPYICDFCSKAFKARSTLISHKRTHTGEKPYSCDVCNKSFSQIPHLKSHKLTHTGERPFSCNICDKSFVQISALKTHKKALHKQ